MTRESPEQRAERITVELRAAAGEAAGVLKDLQRVTRQARAQVDEYLKTGVQEALDHYKAEVERVASHYAQAARTDTEEYAVRSIERAQTAIDNACEIEAIAEMLAAKMARLIKSRHGRQVMDFGVGTDMELPETS